MNAPEVQDNYPELMTSPPSLANALIDWLEKPNFFFPDK